MKQSTRDVYLSVGTIGLLVGATLMVISFFVVVKVSKLFLLTLMLAACYLFYQGLAPSIQRRIQQQIKCHWRDWLVSSRIGRKLQTI